MTKGNGQKSSLKSFLFVLGISINFLFLFFSFCTLIFLFIFVSLLLYALKRLNSLGLCYFHILKHVRMLDLVFLKFCSICCVARVSRLKPKCTLGCLCRLDYAHVGLFIRAHDPAQKP